VYITLFGIKHCLFYFSMMILSTMTPGLMDTNNLKHQLPCFLEQPVRIFLSEWSSNAVIPFKTLGYILVLHLLLFVECLGKLFFKCYNKVLKMNCTKLKEPLVPFKEPHFTNYLVFEDRLRSFLDWPPGILVSKESLAMAGFFYTHSSDKVICFHCGGGLCNWKENDDPFIEHAKWFGRCTYIHLVKGSNFVRNVKTQVIFQQKVTYVIDKLLNLITVQQNSLTYLFNLVYTALTNSIGIECQSKSCKTLKRKLRECETEKLCVMCCQNTVDIAFLNCGHFICCKFCASQVKKCPLCRKKIVSFLRIYK